MQDNTGTLNIQGSLTRIGKRRSIEGNFNVTKFALADDGVNYNLIASNLVDPFIYIERSPMLSVWKDSTAALKYKIPVDNSYPSNTTYFNYNFSVAPLGSKKMINMSGSKNPVSFPVFLNNDSNKEITFYGTTQYELNQQQDLFIEFIFKDLPVTSSNNFLTISLFDNTYFDIALSHDNMRLYQYDAFGNPFSGSLGIDSGSIGQRNWYNSFELGIDKSTDFPKVINVLTTDKLNSNSYNSFLLRYRGNYTYDPNHEDIYQTYLSIYSEETGQTEYILLTINSVAPQS